MEQGVEAVTGTSLVDVGDVVGVLLLARAEQRLDAVTHARFTTFREGSRGRWDRDARSRLATSLVAGTTAVVDGAPVAERLAEQRWLAWFPRPFGPHHAVNVASGAVGWCGARHPGIRLVRSHLAARSWRAELLQAAGALATTGWGARRLDDWVARGDRLDDAEVRWACVVEVTADEVDLVRAWAWGRGPVAARAALGVGVGTGLPPTDLAADDARRLLDDLAGADVLRWSVSGPDAR